MDSLPLEIKQYVFNFTDFETCVKNNMEAKVFFDKKIHTFAWAAKNGHLEVVKWLEENVF